MSAVDTEAGTRGTQVVDRVFDILEAFMEIGPELSASDISRAVGLKYSTAHRLLEAMARRGILYRDHESRRYRTGQKLRWFALASIGQADPVDYARPFLEELTKATGETSHLAVLDEGMALYVDKVESQRFLSRPSHVGRRLPAYCTGVGKAMLAFADQTDVQAVIDRGLSRHSPNTITEPARFRRELAKVQEQGYAIDDEEIEEGLLCIAAPVRDHTGSVVAGVSIGGPASRLRDAGVPQLAGRVRATAGSISTMLGWAPARGSEEVDATSEVS